MILCGDCNVEVMTMRGGEDRSGALFSDVSLEERVTTDHPLRAIWTLVNEALHSLSREFDALYAGSGRLSIPPEHLLRAMLLQAFYSVRFEGQLAERLNFDPLFQWFVGLGIDDRVWDHSTFTKNRRRLLEGDVAQRFRAAILTQPKLKQLLSTEHFSVDGTLIEAWASMKSFQPKDGSVNPPNGGRNGERDFHGERRKNDTHASVTDPETKLYRKGSGKESKLSYMSHALMENRNGLAVGLTVNEADGVAERAAALGMIEDLRGSGPFTFAADKPYDTADFVKDMRERGVTHVAQNNTGRRSAIDARTTRHAGYKASLRCRKRIEEIFGWVKGIGGQTKTKFRGRELVGWAFTFTFAVSVSA